MKNEPPSSFGASHSAPPARRSSAKYCLPYGTEPGKVCDLLRCGNLAIGGAGTNNCSLLSAEMRQTKHQAAVQIQKIWRGFNVREVYVKKARRMYEKILQQMENVCCLPS